MHNQIETNQNNLTSHRHTVTEQKLQLVDPTTISYTHFRGIIDCTSASKILLAWTLWVNKTHNHYQSNGRATAFDWAIDDTTFGTYPKIPKFFSPFFGNNKLPKKVLHASNRKQKLPSNVLQTIYFRGMEEFEDHVTNEQ